MMGSACKGGGGTTGTGAVPGGSGWRSEYPARTGSAGKARLLARKASVALYASIFSKLSMTEPSIRPSGRTSATVWLEPFTSLIWALPCAAVGTGTAA
jgi:hypothetical protein